MSDENIVVDARAALRKAIIKRYGREVVGPMWDVMVPSADPEKGLGSRSADNWRITLRRASETMEAQGYSVAEVTIPEAEEARGEVLNASVALLASKTSGAANVSRLRRDRRLYLGIGAFAAAAVGLAIAALARRRPR
jgi:hypothetical protein